MVHEMVLEMPHPIFKWKFPRLNLEILIHNVDAWIQ